MRSADSRSRRWAGVDLRPGCYASFAMSAGRHSRRASVAGMPIQWASPPFSPWHRDPHLGGSSRRMVVPRLTSRTVTAGPGTGARDPPYLHPPVTASVSLAMALRVQEFDKGRGPVGFPPIGQACDLPVEPDEGPREGSLVKFRGGPVSSMPMPASHGCRGLGWLNLGWLNMLPGPDAGGGQGVPWWRDRVQRSGAGGLSVRVIGRGGRGRGHEQPALPRSAGRWALPRRHDD